MTYYCLLLAAATVCSAGMKADSKSYAEMDLSAYASYEWSTDQEADSGHPLAGGSPLDRRLQEIARGILAGRGLAPSSDGEPDLRIKCIAISKEVQNISGVKKDMGGGVTWVGDVGAHGVTAYRQGTLIIELVDAESEERLWAGWASDALPAVPDPAKVGKKAEKALKKILKQLP
jgi:hypothetical protein